MFVNWERSVMLMFTCKEAHVGSLFSGPVSLLYESCRHTD